MFEGVITAVLNKFLGDYVANLEQNQLNLGNIVLEGLKLKKEALDKLDLPIEVFYGYLGRLELHIPWTSLKTQPVQVVVEDLFLLAGPRVEAEYDAELEEERAQKAKQERLEAVEIFSASVENELADDVHQESFTTQLVTKIVDNLQVTVKNIHIRFEDSTSNPERTFCVGVLLKSLTAVSTDGEWNPTFLVNAHDAVNKLVELDSFALYWNTRERGMKDDSYEDFVEQCRERICDDSHSYILKPVSGEGKATLNKFLKEGIPKTILDIFFDAFALNVNYEQYFDILSALASLSTAQRALPYRKYRPTGKVSPIDLLRFAVTCYRERIHARNEKRKWSYIIQRREDRKEYVNLYSNKIIKGQLTGEDEARVIKYERKLSFDDIAHYRSLARAFAKKSKASAPKGAANRLWTFLGYKHTSAATDLVKEEDIKELYETIDFDASQTGGDDNLPNKAQLVKVNFCLGEGSFSISQDPTVEQSMVTLLFTELSAQFVKRPKTVAVEVALKDLSLSENLLPNTLFRELIKIKPAKAGSPTSDKPLLFISFDQMATNPSADAEVHLELRPLFIIANLITVDKLLKFLLNPKTMPLLDAVKAEAKNAIDAAGVKTRANLQRSLEEHKGMDLHVDIDAPIIMIPEDPTNSSKSMFVVDLGRLCASTVLVSQADKQSIGAIRRQLTDEETVRFHDMLYDKIRVQLSSVRVYFAETITWWNEFSGDQAFKSLPISNKIIDEIDVELTVENSIMSTATNLAKTKLTGVLPEIAVYMSDHKVAKVMSLMKLLPKPEKPKEDSNNDKNKRPPRKPSKRLKKPSPPPTPLLAREATSDQEEFFDTFEDHSSDEGGFTEEEDPFNLLVKFGIKRIFIQMASHGDLEEKPVITFLAEDMGLDMTGYGTCTTIGFYLGGFAIREHCSSAKGSIVLDGEAERRDVNLLNVNVTIVDPSNLGFISVYKEVERCVTIELASIKLMLEPERLCKVAEYVLTRVLPGLETDAAELPEGDSSFDTTAEKLLSMYQPKTEIVFKFSGFTVLLWEQDIKYASITADSLRISIGIVGKRLVLDGDISSLIFTAFDRDGDSCNLIFFEGDSVASFGFETQCVGNDMYLAGSNIAKASTGKLYVVYEPALLANIVNVAVKFMRIVEIMETMEKDKKHTIKAPSADHEGAMIKVMQSVGTYLKVDLESPVVLIPSEDHEWVIGLHLGRLCVANMLERGPETGFDQTFDIRLMDIHISLTAKNEEQRLILQKFTIPLTIRLTENAMARKYADIEIDGTVDDIIADISENDYVTVLKIAMEAATAVTKILDVLPKAPKHEIEEVPSEDAPVDSDKVSEKFPFDADVTFKSIQLRLKDNDDNPKVQLNISGINISAVENTVRGMGVEVCIASIRIADESDQTHSFRELILMGEAAARYNKPLVDPKKQLLFRLDRSVDGSMVVNAYAESPRVFVLFNTIFYLQKFFTSYIPKPPPRPSADTQSHDDETGKKEATLTVLFNLVDATVIIVDDCTIPDTDALALRVGSVSLTMAKDISVAVDEFSCFIFNMSAQTETQIAILEDVSLIVDLQNDKETMRSTLEVSVQPMVISISFQDLKLIQSFAEAMNTAKNLHLPPQKKLDYSQGVQEESLSPPTSPITLSDNASPSAVSRMKETGKISTEGIRLILIDDSASSMVPLLDISVEGMSAELADWSTQLKAFLTGTISSDCYNPSISYWEPVIEPWTFSLSVGPSDVEPAAKNVIMLSSEKGLNILMVHHSLERILQLLQKLASPERRVSTASREISSPYIFSNYLNCQVSIVSAKTVTERLELKQQQSDGFTFEDWREQRTSLLKKRHKVDFCFDRFSPITGIDIDRDGYFKLELRPTEEIEGDEEVREFYLHAFLIGGVRHIHFRESTMIHNETGQTIVLILEGEGEGISMQVEPDQRVCVPPWHMKSQCVISAVGGTYNPIEQKICLSKGLDLDGIILTGSNQSSEGPSLHILVSCAKPSLEQIIDIKFAAPVFIENMLPSTANVQASQNMIRAAHSIAEGKCLSIYDVDPSSSALLAVSIPDLGLFSTTECDIYKGKEVSEVSMKNEDGLELKVALARCMRQDSTIRLSIAAYYVVINQTGMTLQLISDTHYKDKKAMGQVFTVPPAEDGKPFSMFSHPNTKSVKNRVRIRAADSNWSEPISFDAVGAEIELHCKSMLTARWYNIGGYVGLGQGKMVYLSPRYCAVNDTEGELLISDSETVYSLAPGAQVPVHFNPSNTETINVRLTSNPDWSSSFDIKNAGKIYLRESKLKQLFRVARVIQSPNLFISFSLTDSWPFTFRNQSSSDITIQQKNVDQQYSCPTKSELKYSWDQPSFSDKRLIMTVNGKEFNIDLSEVGKKTNLKVKPGEGPGMSLNLEIKAEGPMVVVLIKDRKSKDSEGEDATLQQQEYVESFQDVILVRLPFIAVSLIGSELEEFLLVYVKDLELRYAISKQFTSYGVTIKWLQIDNQSFDWDHPMMLYPAVINKSAKELEEHPFLSLGIIQSRDTSYGVTYFKYFGLLLQEMSIEVGEELLRRLLNFGNFSLLTVQPRTIVTEKDYSIQHYQVGRDSSEVLFFEFFQMHPIKLNLTFSRTEDTEAARKKQISYNPLTTLLDVFTMTIGNISEAPLKFNALVLENILSRKDSLEETVMEHYKQEGLSQIHKVLGSADFLGNPVGLVSTLGSGVTDLFYEPYQGFVSDRPQDIGIGFARGGLSLVKKTVSGVTGTLSKFTGSLAKGLSAATMDKSYQQKRRMDRAKNKPKHALSGVSTGVLQLYSGFKSGITGVVDKPMEGAKEGGVGGFFKGVGVGLVGIVTKPVVGLIDMTTSLSEGIKSSAEDEQNEVTQARFPRVVPYDGKIRVYDEREAFGQSIMANVLGVEKVGSEFYISHLDVPGDNSIVILTSQRLLYISLDRIKSLWQIDNDTITDVKATTDCILVSVAGGSPRTKIIPIIDVGSQKWFVQQIKDCCSCL